MGFTELFQDRNVKTFYLAQVNGMMPMVQFKLRESLVLVHYGFSKYHSIPMSTLSGLQVEQSGVMSSTLHILINGVVSHSIKVGKIDDKKLQASIDFLNEVKQLSHEEIIQKYKIEKQAPSKNRALKFILIFFFFVVLVRLCGNSSNESLVPKGLIRNQSVFLINNSDTLLKSNPSLTSDTIDKIKSNEKAIYISDKEPWIEVELEKSHQKGWVHISNLNIQTTKVPSTSIAQVMCNNFVEKQLKSPSSASFAGAFDGVQAKLVDTDQEGFYHFTFNSWVDSQNSFGAMIRTNFSCRIKSKDGDEWSITNLTSK